MPVRNQSTRQRRPRSPSRVRHPYTSNCGRRRWPPSPKVEEVKYEEEIPMRGKIGQDPMIMDVPYSNGSDAGSTDSRSSDESPGPETPPASVSDNQDRRYVWKPEHDVEIPIAYDRAKGPKPTKQPSAVDLRDNDRGRKAMPKLDTDLARSRSTGGAPPPLERARSPYASGPQDRKPKGDRFSGEYLLSPDVMSPRPRMAESQRAQSHCSPAIGKPATQRDVNQNRDRNPHPIRPPVAPLGRHASDSDPGIMKYATTRDSDPRVDTSRQRQPARPTLENQRTQSHHVPRPVEIHNTGKPDQVRDNPRQSVRPTMERHRSSVDYLEGPSSSGGTRPRSRHHHGHSDESDNDSARFRQTSSQLSPQTPSKYSNSYFDDGRHDERRASSKRPDQRRSLTTSETESHPVNLKSLVSGEGIHHVLNATALSAMLNQESMPARRASPRPSPRPSPGVSPMASPHASPYASPTTSPYASPPRTPPNERRTNPITGLKKDSPASRPSPLSSHPSILATDPNLGPHETDHGGRPRLVSRRTTPLLAPRVDEPAPMLAPGISVRSPSPAYHAKANTAQSGQFQHPHSRADSVAETELPQSSSLRPGYSGRRRALSSADVRPQLTVNPASFVQPSDSALSPTTRPRPTSPGLPSPSERYKPGYLESGAPAVRSSSSHPDSSTAGTRSKSYAPTPPSPGQRSHSSVPMSGPSRPRAMSSSSRPVFPAPPPKPASLPICPRPDRVAGKNDWYTLHHNTAFAICPDCRENVFGANYERYLMPHTVPTQRKTQCDLNNPWIRLACLLHGPDINILGKLSEITSKEDECPRDEEEPREWYHLEDPASGKRISNFNACPQCVHSLELLFPSWRGEFYRSQSSNHHELKERTCALRASSIRFGEYLDLVIESANEADRARKAPDSTRVAQLAKRIASIRDCPRDSMESRKAWHIHSHVPEFTICPACHEDVVYPLAKKGLSIAKQIDREPQMFPNPEVEVCCHLYSTRMRKILREACEDDDLEHLRHNALKRHMLQQDLFAVLAERESHPGDEEVDRRGRELLEMWRKKE